MSTPQVEDFVVFVHCLRNLIACFVLRKLPSLYEF